MEAELTKRSFADLSDINVEFFTTPMPSDAHLDILVVRFLGEYPAGGAGNSDADYMTAMVRAGLEAWPAFGLVLDFTHLKYVWGDMMEKVLDAGASYSHPRATPTAVVTSPLNSEALTSLVKDEMGDDAGERLFDSMHDAITKINATHELLY